MATGRLVMNATKIVNVLAALALGIASLLFLLSGGDGQPARAQTPANPERPLVFVPGLMGSKLCRTGPDGEKTVIWGTADALGNFADLEAAVGDGVFACGLIGEVTFLGVFTQTVYGPFMARLEEAGYREGETLFVFDYDWRQSVFVNVDRLAGFIAKNLPDDQAFDIVAHSMGGLLARAYALEQDAAPIARFVTAGAPWRGSVRVFELLREGWGLGNLLLGGVESFRRTAMSFPSTFELLPDYDGCCASEASGGGFDATSAAGWDALHWSGIEGERLPDFRAVTARQAQLRDIAATPLRPGTEEALVIGIDQRTAEHYALETGEGEARLNVVTSWEGDGTVMRDSAMLPERAVYSTSFARHDAILNDEAVQDFVLAALAFGPAEALERVPVRERTSVLTALGDIVELVGVAVSPRQPAYQTGSSAQVDVHLRLGIEAPVDAATLSATATLPGGTTIDLPLVRDPAASDPSNPFEQSFSAVFGVGDTPGKVAVTVVLESANGAPPRVVSSVVPVVGG